MSKLSNREKQLIAAAQTELLVAEMKESGLVSLLEGFFQNINPFAMAKKGFNQAKTNVENEAAGTKGMWGRAVFSLIERSKDLPTATEELITQADKGLNITKECLDMIEDEETKKFFEEAIKKSASKIAAAQEREMKVVANAIAKKIRQINKEEDDDDEALNEDHQRAYAGLIVQAAIFGALKINLK